MHNDLKLLDFVLMALKDGDVKNEKSLIRIACQYGKSFRVKPKDIEKILEKKLIDFL